MRNKQYDFYGEFYSTPLNQSSEIKRKEKKEIRYYGMLAGMGIIGFLIIQELFGLVVSLTGTADFIYGEQLPYQCVTMLIAMAAILIPFAIVMKLEKKKTDVDLLPLTKPNDPLLTVLAIPAGVSLCLLGSYMTSVIVIFMEYIGIALSSPDLSSPISGYPLLVYLLRLTLVAALIEETSMRGIVMQPLRKYGNGFAILMSSMVFAFMHCNLVQAPFAFMAGIAIGYFSIATGSLWTGVAIHLLNNLISGISEYFTAIGQEEFGTRLTGIIIYTLILTGAACIVLFFKRKKTITGKYIGLREKKQSLTALQRFGAYFLNPPMIIAFLAICYYTSAYIDISKIIK